MRPALTRHLRRRSPSDVGGAASGVLVAILIIAAVVVGAFFYFGGEADVDINNPDVSVTSDETPS